MISSRFVCLFLSALSCSVGLSQDSKLAHSIFESMTLNNAAIRQADAFGSTEIFDDVDGRKIVHSKLHWRMVFDLDQRKYCFVQTGERLTESISSETEKVKSKKSMLVDYAFVADGIARTRSFPGEWMRPRVNHESAALREFLIPDIRSIGIDTMPRYWNRSFSPEDQAKFFQSKFLILRVAESGRTTNIQARVVTPGTDIVRVKADWEIENATSVPVSKRVYYERDAGGKIERQPYANEHYKFREKKEFMFRSSFTLTSWKDIVMSRTVTI